MPVVAWILRNWKVVGAVSVVVGICGYIMVLRAGISNLERKYADQGHELATVKKDLDLAKGGIDNVNVAVKRYQKFVTDSLAAVASVQDRIMDQNEKLQKVLDSLAAQAAAARRIADAPRFPFFTQDNAVPAGLVRVDPDGTHHFRVLPESD